MKINRNQNLRIVAIAFATVAIGLIINILSPDAETWCRDVLGENYKRNLLVILPVLAISAIVLSDWQKLFRTETIAAPEPVAASESIHAEIRKYLKSRYKHRLAQKLASRQPVNLRKIPSRTGTSDEGAASFITLREEEVRQAIGDIFTQSKGRLLVVGLPGAGKTTLLLQLA
ncbi:MAG: ATP-binding protein, partial [Saprospiraceae bacterium]|nr:ATP-binding protein [Saprospiraceae bacterium]